MEQLVTLLFKNYKDRINSQFLKTEKESRNCIAILHEGMQTEILESGPTLTLEEGQAFLETFTELLSKVSLITVSGSLPKGLSHDFYHDMLVISHKNNVPLILDTSGEPLKQVLLQKEKPFAIKPNETELAQLIGTKVSSDDVDGLKQALSNELFSGIEVVLVSLGSKGAFVKHNNRFYRVNIPTVEVVNPVGSGDATVAGLAVALHRGESIEEALKTSMTTGILNTMEPGTGSINVKNFRHYFGLVEVKEV